MVEELRKSPSGPEVLVPSAPITSDEVSNESGVSGDTVTEALDNLAAASGGVPIESTRYVDIDTTVPVLTQDGSIGKPFSTIAAALAALEVVDAVVSTVLVFTGNYQAEVLVWNPAGGGSLIIGSVNVSQSSVTLGAITHNFSQLVINDCILNGDISQAAPLQLNRCFSQPRTFSCGSYTAQGGTLAAVTLVCTDDLFIDNCLITEQITISIGTAVAQISNTRLPPFTVITFTGAAGVLKLDGQSYYWWQLNGGSLVNGTIKIMDGETVSFAVNAGTLDTGPSLTSISVLSATVPELAGLLPGDSVCATMRNELNEDGVCLLYGTVQAPNAVRLTFLNLLGNTFLLGTVTFDLGIVRQ